MQGLTASQLCSKPKPLGLEPFPCARVDLRLVLHATLLKTLARIL
jgi:hypothetical protein